MIFYGQGSPGFDPGCRYILQDFLSSYIYIITYIYVEFLQ